MQTFAIFRLWMVPVIMLLVTACSNETASKNSTSDITQPQLKGEELVERGQLLVTAGGCNDCHSPKVFGPHGMSFDSSRLLSGHPAASALPVPDQKALQPGQWMQMAPDVTAFVGPWGISYAANLTPDSATGIGAWTEDVFIRTLQTGKHLGMENGRPVLPPMPWYNLAALKQEDLRAIYAYLKSLPPVKNKVPAPVSAEEVKKSTALTK
jgi:hypothetical protein